jgi:hypothetical protein
MGSDSPVFVKGTEIPVFIFTRTADFLEISAKFVDSVTVTP